MVSSLPAGVTAAQTSSDVEPADEIYVDENGDAVLVYNETNTGNATGEYGFDVANDILYTYVNEENATDPAVDAELGLNLTSDMVSGEGYFEAPVTQDNLSELDLSVNGTQTADTASARAELLVVLNETSDNVSQLGGMTTESSSVSTAANVTVTADRVASDGVVNVTGANVTNDTYFDVAVSTTSDGATIDATQRQTIAENQTRLWDTETNATRTLNATFGQVAQDLNGSADVQVLSYSFDNQTNELDITYTVEYSGVKEAAGQVIAGSLQSNTTNLTETQAQNLAENATKIDVRTIAVTVDANATDNTVDAAWEIDVRNLSPLIEANFAVAEQMDDGEMDSELQAARDRYDAAKQSNYEQTVSWDITVAEQASTTELNGSLAYDTNNRSAYTSALQTNTTDIEYNVTARTVDSNGNQRLAVNASVTAQGEQLLDKGIDSVVSTLGANETDSGGVAELLQSAKAADLERAKVDASVRDGTVEVEAGGTFQNVSEFQGVIENQYGGQSVTHLYGNVSQDSNKRYVYVANLTGENATEEDVRSLAVADNQTQISLPEDNWTDDFPRLNVSSAGDFIGVQTNTSDDGSSDGTDDSDDGDFAQSDGAGFGALAALLALVSVLLLNRRD